MEREMKATLGAIAMALLCVLVSASVIKLAERAISSIARRPRPVEPNPLDLGLCPSPVRTPGGVVRAQMDALRRDPMTDRTQGIATLHNLVAPSARAKMGTFENALTRPGFIEMWTQFGPVRVKGKTAQQVVEIVDKNQARAWLVFTVVLQENGPFANCWMTTNISRLYKVR